MFSGSIGVGARMVNPVKLGLALAVLSTSFHALWAVLVAAGLAQGVADFILWVHFIRPAFMVDPFDIGRAGLLLAVTATVAFAIGCVFGWAWNLVHK